MAKRQVSEERVGTDSDQQQIDKSPTAAKKKKVNEGVSRIVDLLNQSDITLGNPPTTVDPVNTNEDDTPATGRQRGAKNYTNAELTLLNKCMAAAAPIGPQEITAALATYSRIAKDKGWVARGEKALRQKWDKVSTECTHTQLCNVSPSQSSQPSPRDPVTMI